jgi:hypothetical protein
LRINDEERRKSVKKSCTAILTIGVLLMLLACSSAVVGTGAAQNEAASGPVNAQHPQLSDQDKLRPCFECHKDITPQIYTQWNNSAHGIGNVKCYQCHGTYEDMYKVPAVSNCSMCHAAEAEDYGDETPCWNCHLSHTFKGH